jgi:hypothetical protein
LHVFLLFRNNIALVYHIFWNNEEEEKELYWQYIYIILFIDNKTNITYSWATAWSQWVFGISSYSDSSSMSDVPVDPVTWLEYAYSVTASRQEYQIAAVLENIRSSKLTSSAHAWIQEAEVYVRWNYNGKFLKVRSNTTTYLLWVPSILASDITSVDAQNILTEIINNKKLVYKWYKNLPASYSGSVYNIDGWFDFTPAKLVLFEWDIKDLESNQTKRVTFLDNLQTNYIASEIASETDIVELLAVDSSSTSEANNYVATTLNNSLKTKISISNRTLSTVVWNDSSGCDKPDITIWSYTIASCNAGTSITWTGANSYGGLYQWGNNADLRFAGLSINSILSTTDNSTFNNNVFIGSFSSPFDWTVVQNDNLWWDTTDTNQARQWPCNEWYHVPTQWEWSWFMGDVNTIIGSTTWAQITNLYQIPLAGFINFQTGNLDDEWYYGKYWTSSASGLYAVSYWLDISNTLNSGFPGRARAHSVRCFKN